MEKVDATRAIEELRFEILSQASGLLGDNEDMSFDLPKELVTSWEGRPIMSEADHLFTEAKLKVRKVAPIDPFAKTGPRVSVALHFLGGNDPYYTLFPERKKPFIFYDNRNNVVHRRAATPDDLTHFARFLDEAAKQREQPQ